MYKFDVPEMRKVRVIIDTDAKCEADDQFAIVHALLTPKIIVKGLIAAHFGRVIPNDSMIKSYEECKKISEIMNVEVPIFKGSEYSLDLSNEYENSEGADFIIKEAMTDDPRPLFVLVQGAITNLASAYLKEPKIADKLTAIWIGGGSYPIGHNEYNLGNDIDAANVIFNSNIELWQVPSTAYGKMMVSLAELQVKVYPYGKIGKYLFEQMVEFNSKFTEKTFWPRSESWSLGDSPVIGLILDEHMWSYDIVDAPTVDKDTMLYHKKEDARKIRVYNEVDSRFILEDFFAKLKINAENI